MSVCVICRKPLKDHERVVGKVCAEKLIMFPNSHDTSIRRDIARNKETPKTVLNAMIKDSDKYVRFFAQKNPNTSKSELRRMVSNGYALVKLPETVFLNAHKPLGNTLTELVNAQSTLDQSVKLELAPHVNKLNLIKMTDEERKEATQALAYFVPSKKGIERTERYSLFGYDHVLKTIPDNIDIRYNENFYLNTIETEEELRDYLIDNPHANSMISDNKEEIFNSIKEKLR